MMIDGLFTGVVDHARHAAGCAVPVALGIEPATADLARLVDEYTTRGYALFALDVEPTQYSQALVALGHALSLGDPFVPELYRSATTRHLYDRWGVNAITERQTRDGGACVHPAFESSSALELHTDGTLQAIGEIRTSMLLCVTPAEHGGETVLFHAVDAFLLLQARRADLARGLLDPRALTRRATVDGAGACHVGPVVAIEDGDVMTRYSTTARDEYAFEDVPGLRAACEELAWLARPSGPYYREERIAAGQGILLANDKLCHGRKAYRSGPSRPRHMLRALFAGRPRSPGAVQR
jgi:hypothetical protein